MQTNKILSMLGFARRSGSLSQGHDAAIKAVKSGRARVLLFCSDVSPRLVGEFEKAVNGGRQLKTVSLNLTMNELYYAAGIRAGVMTVDDEKLSRQIISLSEQEEQINGH